MLPALHRLRLHDPLEIIFTPLTVLKFVLSVLSTSDYYLGAP